VAKKAGVDVRFTMKLLLLIFLIAGAVESQSAPSRKDIPAIAKSANGAIVTIVMANGEKPIAQGTGFLVTADGVIVTNYHVIENGDVATVKFPDGSTFPVDGLLASDKVRDLAVIKIHGKTFPTLMLGNSDRVQVGDEVVAIGNPFSLESTVSNGIISGVRTSKERGGNLLQTTAPITHGSSGGPLFNMVGEVIGITSLGFEGAGNLNFAIPVNDVKILLSHQSAKLENLPNEKPSESATSAQGNENSRDFIEKIAWLHAKTGHRDLDSDDLKGTLRWIQDTLPEGSSECLQFPGNPVCFKTYLPFRPKDDLVISGCTVKLETVATTMIGTPQEHAARFYYYLDLGNVDLDRIYSKSERDQNNEEYKDFYINTWNDTKTIDQLEVPSNVYRNQISFRLTPDYSVRFEKAFRRAVELCGGRPSTVKF
jgi:hypothetical protein